MQELIAMTEMSVESVETTESGTILSTEQTTIVDRKSSAVEDLQHRLLREIERLEWLLSQVAKGPMGSRQILASAYRDMIAKRSELLKSLD